LEHGIENIEAHKDIRRGINAVAERLTPDVQGKPHLVFHDCCVETIREIESYVWAQRHSGHQDQPDAPLKANDHAMDELRYQCVALQRSEFARIRNIEEDEAA